MNDSAAVFLPKGFKFSSVTAGIKASGRPDLALILAEGGAKAAALFTKNRIVAAPIEVGRACLKKRKLRNRTRWDCGVQGSLR